MLENKGFAFKRETINPYISNYYTNQVNKSTNLPLKFLHKNILVEFRKNAKHKNDKFENIIEEVIDNIKTKKVNQESVKKIISKIPFLQLLLGIKIFDTNKVVYKY